MNEASVATTPRTQPMQHQGGNSHVLLRAADLYKTYILGRVDVPVLKGASLDIHQGEWVAILGSSGSGKSTLMHLLGDLDHADPGKGDILFDGVSLQSMSGHQRNCYRNKSVGFVFQFYHLLPELSTLENVLMPLMIAQGVLRYRFCKQKNVRQAKHLLDMVGLSHRLKHKPSELSGGEMQRAAIARALVAEPDVLLADEPTGNLDKTTGEEILALLRSLNDERNLTIVMVTHDGAIARQADRTVVLVDGVVQEA